MPQVFISYSIDAKAWAEKIAAYLEQNGISTWLDSKQLKPGDNWVAAVERTIHKCTHFLIVVGPKKIPGDQQDRQWQLALGDTWKNPKKQMIPVLLDGAPAPAFLQNWPAVKLPAGKDEAAALEKIHKAVTAKRTSSVARRAAMTAKDLKAWQGRLKGIESVAMQLKSLLDK